MSYPLLLFKSVLALLLFSLSGCLDRSNDGGVTVEMLEFKTVESEKIISSPHRSLIAGIALWEKSPTESMILASSESLQCIFLLDAFSGKTRSTLGGVGHSQFNFQEPHGLFVIDNLLFVVDRGNRRVEVFSLPSFRFLGFVGESLLLDPCEIYVEREDSHYVLYVTDDVNSETALSVLAEAELEGLDYKEASSGGVKRFTVGIQPIKSISNSNVELIDGYAFGQPEGPCALEKAHVIVGDPENNRILVSDQTALNVKIYSFDGHCTGLLGDGIFAAPPNGVALVPTRRERGYWVVSSHDDDNAYFFVFDRQSLEFIGGFQCVGILDPFHMVFTKLPAPGFLEGRLYVLYKDGGIALLDWKDVQSTLGLNLSI